MNKNTLFEILSALVFCAIALALLNPAHFWMPSMSHLSMLAVLLAAFGAFVVFLLREQASDEREEANRSFADRAAFLVGSAVLVLGIAIESRTHIDSWLVGALLALVVVKVATGIWSDRYR